MKGAEWCRHSAVDLSSFKICSLVPQVPQLPVTLCRAMASDAVLEAFKRFDADGSGSISREELSEILKTLDESLDDAAVDSLLLLADASGDGEL